MPHQKLAPQKSVTPHTSAAYNGVMESTTPTLSSLEVGDDSEMLYNAVLNNTPAGWSLDNEATNAFMSQKAALMCGLNMSASDLDVVELGNGSTVEAEGSVTCQVSIDGYQSEKKDLCPSDARQSRRETARRNT